MNRWVEKFLARRFSRHIQMAERMPRGWGVAYWHWDTMTGIIMPVPLNLVVGGARWFWYRLVGGIYPTMYDKMIERGILIEKQNKVNMAADHFDRRLESLIDLQLRTLKILNKEAADEEASKRNPDHGGTTSSSLP